MFIVRLTNASALEGKQSKTILAKGGSGYIGSHTYLKLLEEGHNLVVVDN